MALRLFAPKDYPTKHAERRAYTIAAFRIAQESDQLSLVSMPKPVITFFMKDTATQYWMKKGWLHERDDAFHLSGEGLVICQSALAEQLASHNTDAATVQYWVQQFTSNTSLPRSIQTC
jgi:hypothetical protein